jgi:hypothetical protein
MASSSTSKTLNWNVFRLFGSGRSKDYDLLLSNTTHWNERLAKVKVDKVHMFFEPVTIGRYAHG